MSSVINTSNTGAFSVERTGAGYAVTVERYNTLTRQTEQTTAHFDVREIIKIQEAITGTVLWVDAENVVR